MENLLLQRVTGHEIEHEYLALLTNAIDASDALLDGHRIPRHVEIDQRIAELYVAALAARFGAKEHRHSRAEIDNGGVLVWAAHAAFKAREGEPFTRQKVGEVIERLVVVDEDQLLLIRIAPQQVQQGRLASARTGSHTRSGVSGSSIRSATQR